MAVRNNFAAGEVLAAADLNDTFASKLPYSYGTATPSTTTSGFLWYDSNSTPAATKYWDGSAFIPFGGKILQIVRDTDSTDRTTTSTSFVDVTGMSVTITPQKSDSALLILATGFADVRRSSAGTTIGDFTLTDSSNNSLSGAQQIGIGNLNTTVAQHSLFILGYVTPATTSAVTYKLRFRANEANITTQLYNSTTTGQMYAIEVSA